MFLEKIRIENFRIFSELNINFHPKINIIFGRNGQGKTSILEAIYFLSITKSFKAKTDTYVLKHEREFFDIKGSCNNNTTVNELRIYFSRSDGKHVFLDKQKVKTFSEIVGQFPAILLSLEDIELTFGMPASRRKFLDVLLSQLYPGYLFALQKYKKSVLQKNKLLSLEDYPNKLNELDIWNKQLIEFAVEILMRRMEFVDYLNRNINSSYTTISAKEEKIEVLYKTNSGILKNDYNSDQIKKIFSETLEKSKPSELKRQSCLFGPHRDDLEFLKDGYSFKSHGSQGENKSFLIALKLIESQYIFDVSKKRPLMLLDDIFGELDSYRIENLLEIITDHGQTFITTTDDQKGKNIIADTASLFHLENSLIKQ
ncbi:MAG: DNA replication/repair protein RecF [Calditrichaeota bacterium]|nr:MAG: DNA replication/repair protein RecF [Calditrichota bacterium]MBL1205454.1 DNA replication/repair protein RecF [Calditrichota bacterium]NOG45283.1 DNA replication/repair protein RecF [Calditrichota bacterium]